MRARLVLGAGGSRDTLWAQEQSALAIGARSEDCDVLQFCGETVSGQQLLSQLAHRVDVDVMNAVALAAHQMMVLGFAYGMVEESPPPKIGLSHEAFVL